MRQESFRAIGFVVLAGVAVAGVSLLLPKALDSAGGTDVELAAAIKATEPDGLSVQVPGFSVPLISTQHAYTHVSFSPERPGQPASLASTLDLTGHLGDIEVSSLGLEHLRFEKKTLRWEPVDGWAPGLSAALALLERRRGALDQGDVKALGLLVLPTDRAGALADPRLHQFLNIRQRRYRVTRWLLRLERGETLVTEEGRVTGDLPERPVDDLTTVRLHLVSDGREFFFSPALM